MKPEPHPPGVSMSPTPTPVVRRGRPSGPSDFWLTLGVRIAMAGATYAFGCCVVGGLITSIVGVSSLIAGNGDASLAVGLLVSIGVGVYVALLAFVVTGAVTLVVLPVVRVALRVIGWRPPRDSLAMFCGAFVASLFMSPFFYAVAESLSSGLLYDPVGLVIVVLIVSALVVGQWWSAGAALMDVRRRRRRRQLAKRGATRFSIRQLMGATVTLSVCLVALRAMGGHVTTLLAGVAFFLAVHLLIRGPVTRLLNYRLDRRMRTRRAKRLAAAKRST